MPNLLSSLVDHSHQMAQLLTSLTKHFDLCVTAVRTTEGGADLARRKAAEVTQSQGGDVVSISGVIAEQESQISDLEPNTLEDRDEMVRIVEEDATEVDGVVREINERLLEMESEFTSLTEQVDQIKDAYAGTLGAFRALEEVGARITSYVAAETEFVQRWDEEKYAIGSTLDEMETLRDFYEKYSQAYESMRDEMMRRRAVEDKIHGVWRKARDAVDRLIDDDWRKRQAFQQDLEEYLPADLWPGIGDPLRKWEVLPVREGEAKAGE